MIAEVSQYPRHSTQFLFLQHLLDVLEVAIFNISHCFGISSALIGAVHLDREPFGALGKVRAYVINEVVVFGCMSNYAQVLQFAVVGVMVRSSTPQFNKNLI